jgi:hypothetical protein
MATYQGWLTRLRSQKEISDADIDSDDCQEVNQLLRREAKRVIRTERQSERQSEQQ